MATLTATNPTFIDLVKTMAPDGSIMDVAEVLNETNEILDDMSFMEGNLTTGHRHNVRTGLPSVTWGQLYKGVQASKGNTVQVTDQTGFLESMSEPDARLVDMASDPMMFRAIEDRSHIEAMSQEFANTLFKGTAADADKFIGFESRYNDSTADNGENILNGGATSGDVYSIWLVYWSPMTCFGIVPKNSTAGLQQQDYGKVWLENGDGNNGRMQVYRTYFRMDGGLCLKDWRYVVRIANLKPSEITNDAATGPNLPNLMKEAIERVPSQTGRPAFYMNRTIRQKLRVQMSSAISSSTLTMEDVGGISPRKKLHFDGIPVNRVDALATAESVVTFS